MGPLQDSAIQDIARAIKNLDSCALTIHFVTHNQESHAQARSLLWDILKNNQYKLDSKYRAVKI